MCNISGTSTRAITTRSTAPPWRCSTSAARAWPATASRPPPRASGPRGPGPAGPPPGGRGGRRGRRPCLLTDAWEGIEMFLEPEREVLVAADGDEVAARLRGLTEQDARRIGRAAKGRILAEHTYAHRAAQVESILGLSDPTGAGARIPAGLEAHL